MVTTQVTNYRVISILTNDRGAYSHGRPSEVHEVIKWSGTNLDELSRQYPPSSIFEADPLGHSEIEGGLTYCSYRFERQSEDGNWGKIDDPRRRLTPVTDCERTVDKENCRLYPGDCITECSKCGYGNCRSSDNYDRHYIDNCPNAGCVLCEDSFSLVICYGCGSFHEFLGEEGLCTKCENYPLEELKS